MNNYNLRNQLTSSQLQENYKYQMTALSLTKNFQNVNDKNFKYMKEKSGCQKIVNLSL